MPQQKQTGEKKRTKKGGKKKWVSKGADRQGTACGKCKGK